MRPVIPFLAVLLAVILLTSGCTMPGGAPAATPTPTPLPATETTVQTAVPTPTPTPNPFPDAMAPGQFQEWQSGRMTLKGTVTKVILTDTYEWYSDSWGKWYVQDSENPSDKYLFVFVRLVNGGPDVGRMPSAEMFDLFSGGKEYFFDPDRSAQRVDSPFGKDTEIPIRIGGADISEKDYYYLCDAGYIRAGESNAIEGYLIYVVPADISLDDTFLRVIFNVNSTGVWNLGSGQVKTVTTAPTAVQTATLTAAPTAQATEYTEVYHDADYYMYYQNGKKTFSYTLVKSPLVIDYTLVPEIKSDVKISGTAQNIKEIPVNYTDPDSWFKVTVKKAGSEDIVLEEGFGKGLDADTEKTFMVRNPGSYDILLEGNKINVTIVMKAPVV